VPLGISSFGALGLWHTRMLSTHIDARVGDLGELPPPWTSPPVDSCQGSTTAAASRAGASTAAAAAVGWRVVVVSGGFGEEGVRVCVSKRGGAESVKQDQQRRCCGRRRRRRRRASARGKRTKKQGEEQNCEIAAGWGHAPSGGHPADPRRRCICDRSPQRRTFGRLARPRSSRNPRRRSSSPSFISVFALSHPSRGRQRWRGERRPRRGPRPWSGARRRARPVMLFFRGGKRGVRVSDEKERGEGLSLIHI
jgi:hypothetical protein